MLSAHYRAADIVATGGQAVPVWEDVSGNARHLTSPVGAVLNSTGIKGHPALDFDGVAEQGYTSSWAEFGGAFTVYAVVQTDATDSDIISANGGTGFFLYDRTGNWVAFQNGQQIIAASTRGPTVLAYSVDSRGNAYGLSCDRIGNESQVSFTGVRALTADSQLFVGGPYDAGTRYLKGSLAEVLVFDEAHNPVALLERSRGLAMAYDLPLPVSRWGPHAEVNMSEEGPSLVEQILSRRERVPAYQATGVSGVGDDAEMTVGQVWPR